jgi:hypothetical protein
VKSHGRSHDGRGRHRRASSPETRRFHELERDPGSALNVKPPDPPKPKRLAGETSSARPPLAQPPWLSDDEYAALLELRANLEGRG